jgi:hypothetical protein
MKSAADLSTRCTILIVSRIPIVFASARIHRQVQRFAS